MGEFTPGPWKWIDSCCELCQKDSPNETILESGYCGGIDWGKNKEANSHLIAAAPDMYEALEGLMEAFDNLKGGLPDSTFTDPYFKMFYALKKARGEFHE